MNIYLRRFIAMRSTTPRERLRARMLSLRSTEQQVTAEIRRAWIALMEAHEAVARCKVLQQEVTSLRTHVAELTQEVADMREQVAARLNRLERFTLRSSVRGEGWWRKDPRIETFLRGAVVQLRQEGLSDTQILMDVLIGLSPSDLASLRAA